MVSGVEIDAFKEEREDRDQRRLSRIGEKRYQSTQCWKENSEWKTCPDFGNKHAKGNCPAFGRPCNKCKKLNHYAKLDVSVKRENRQR